MTFQDNLFLKILPRESFEQITRTMREMDMPSRLELYHADEAMEFAYFPCSGFASIVVSVLEGGSAEVGMIGSEGFAGATHLLGPIPSNTRCMIQMAGRGYRLPFADLKRLFEADAEIRRRTLELVQSQTVSLSQIAACNKLHDAEERLARWFLMAQDRVKSDTLTLTQEFIAEMLGTRRSTVALVAGSMQRSGIIEYRRGTVKIVNRARLEEAACECYAVVKDAFSGMYRA